LFKGVNDSEPPPIRCRAGSEPGESFLIPRADSAPVQNDITAGAAGSTSQQILDRGADLRFGIVLVYKIPIELI
jgi:hypothetical protein